MLYAYKNPFFYQDYNCHQNFCILRLYKLERMGEYIGVATEPIEYKQDKNGRVYGDYACKGAGITNAAEYLLAEIERQYEVKISRLFLHYPPRWEQNSRTALFTGTEEFCEVSWLDYRQHPFYSELFMPDSSTAKFQHLQITELEELLNEKFTG
jgi:hypothetical protein